MNAKMKNIELATVLSLKEQIAYQPGQVVSKTLAQNPAVSITLFSFDKGEEISTHASGGDAMVTCLDGVAKSPSTDRLSAARGRKHHHAGGDILMPSMAKKPSRCCSSSYSDQQQGETP